VNEPSRKKPAAGEQTPEAERRRIGTVVHDDRGNASVKWRDAPADYRRPVLEVTGEIPLSVKSEESHDPYAHRVKRRGATSARTDLRKLSEHIKRMRELEERKRRGDSED
jgi:hypothetical protein